MHDTKLQLRVLIVKWFCVSWCQRAVNLMWLNEKPNLHRPHNHQSKWLTEPGHILSQNWDRLQRHAPLYYKSITSEWFSLNSTNWWSTYGVHIYNWPTQGISSIFDGCKHRQTTLRRGSIQITHRSTTKQQELSDSRSILDIGNQCTRLRVQLTNTWPI